MILPSEFAQYIKINFPSNTPLRLLSCSNLDAAEQLSKQLNRSIIATESKVILYEDGGIGTANNSDWYLIEQGGRKLVRSDWDRRPPKNSKGGYLILDSKFNSFVDEVLSQRDKLRDNIINSYESRSIAELYFERIPNNLEKYPDFAWDPKYKDDFETWYKDVFLGVGTNFHAHHVFPYQIFRDRPYLQKILFWAYENGEYFNYHDDLNGIMLIRRTGEAGDHANHPEWNNQLLDYIEVLEANHKEDYKEAFSKFEDKVIYLRQKIEDKVVLGDNIVNDLSID